MSLDFYFKRSSLKVAFYPCFLFAKRTARISCRFTAFKISAFHDSLNYQTNKLKTKTQKLKQESKIKWQKKKSE